MFSRVWIMVWYYFANLGCIVVLIVGTFSFFKNVCLPLRASFPFSVIFMYASVPPMLMIYSIELWRVSDHAWHDVSVTISR